MNNNINNNIDNNNYFFTDMCRGKGRTTCLMLYAIADAIKAQGDIVEFIDHYMMSGQRINNLKGLLESLVSTLGLKIEVIAGNGRIYLISKG